MKDSSPILALSYLHASQAQKHVTHNEALQLLYLLYLLVQMRVAGFDAQTPPDLPQEDALYQSPYVLTSFAHSRVAIDLIVSGIPERALQASQQASRMAS